MWVVLRRSAVRPSQILRKPTRRKRREKGVDSSEPSNRTSPKTQQRPSAVARRAGNGGCGGSPVQAGESRRGRPHQPPPRQYSLRGHHPPPIKDAARTTALARRWRPLWRASPLNLDDARLPRRSWDCISKILAEHRGPGRRLRLRHLDGPNSIADLAEWIRSPALDGLEEIHISYRYDLLLPPCALRFAPTLRVASFARCRFPEHISPTLAFPHLTRLALTEVETSEDALHALLAACSALRVLQLDWCGGFDRVVIDSPTLQSFGIVADSYVGELVIQYAPRLERLIAFDNFDIHVITAPRLHMVCFLDSHKTTLHVGTMASRVTTAFLEQSHSFLREYCRVSCCVLLVCREFLVETWQCHCAV
ncbi:hypothetical protein VPH35_015021 [Triticum aestivum]